MGKSPNACLEAARLAPLYTGQEEATPLSISCLFGDLEDPPGSIRWPLDDGFVMSTTGFEETFEYSIPVTLKKIPNLTVRVCTPPGLAVLKLIAWREKYPERSRDAQDLAFLMEHYVDAGNDSRLHDQDSDIVSMKDFDYGLASARLLGRDMAKIASAETRVRLETILSEETDRTSGIRLVPDMLKGRFDMPESLEKTLAMLRQLALGFQEK